MSEAKQISGQSLFFCEARSQKWKRKNDTFFVFIKQKSWIRSVRHDEVPKIRFTNYWV